MKIQKLFNLLRQIFFENLAIFPIWEFGLLKTAYGQIWPFLFLGLETLLQFKNAFYYVFDNKIENTRSGLMCILGLTKSDYNNRCYSSN
jgi:hypothetical protein